VVLVLIGVVYLFGAQIGMQLYALVEKLPAATESLSKSVPFLSKLGTRRLDATLVRRRAAG
ncbi:MAG: hypothetical protein WC829_21375, partial [Hyphomicrobium sp.]|jgi:hypothetical protein